MSQDDRVIPTGAIGRGERMLALLLALTLTACASAETGGRTGGGDAGDVGSDGLIDTELGPAEPFCGDGHVDDDEECDDENAVDDDACSNDCHVNPATPCSPCEEDGDCGRPIDLCVVVDDGTFCGRDCTADDCPEGYDCAEVRDGDAVLGEQCVPDAGYCADCPDADGDEVCDTEDVCASGDDALDGDGDGVPDACDLCPTGEDSADADGDGVPDACDVCAEGDDTVDGDADGAPDACDLCLLGDDAVDSDGDGAPNACDRCQGADDRLDADGDGVPDFCDVCPAGDDGVDGDADGVADACDRCPGENDALDADSDGVPDGCDVCRGGNDALDGDGDTVPNFCDRCPGADDRLDADGDGVPDFCDVCAGGDDAVDSDGDEVPDFCDCDAAGCSSDASCLETPTGTVCTCLDGFRGDGFDCVDINECEEGLAQCDEHADCLNDPGTFRCECREGWRGTGEVCADVDECEEEVDDCANAAECTNTLGGFECACLPGYQGDGRVCTDIDECVLGIAGCAEDADCNNFGGGFSCDCQDDLAGNGRACFPRTRVLVYHDSSGSRADEAVASLGLPLSYAGSAAAFPAAFDDGGFGLIVVDAPAGALPTSVRDRLFDWVRMGGDLVFSWWNLDADAELRALLGVGSVTEFTTWRDVYADAGSPTAIFDYMEQLPSPLVGVDAFFDDGDELTLGGAGYLMARFDSAVGPGAIALTRDGRAVVNGFLLTEANATDADDDGVPDVQELVANEMAVVLEREGCEIVEGFEEGTWPLPFWTVGRVEGSYPGVVDGTTPRHGAYGIKNVGWYYESGEPVGQAGDRVVAWLRATSDGRAYLGFGATASGTRSLVFAPNTSELQFQSNDGYSSYAEESSVTQAWEADLWYRAEIEYLTSSRVQGRIYGADGTLVRSLTYDFGTAQPGGVALRGFGDLAIDSVAICRP